jgi:membrane-bound lytic murein transglycosylase A
LRILRLILISVLFQNCLSISYAQKTSYKLIATSFKFLNNWDHNDFQASLGSFRNSCKIINRKSADKVIKKKIVSFSNHHLQDLCDIAETTESGDERAFFQENFDVYNIKNSKSSYGKLTGYYIPYLQASMEQTDIFKYPVYAMPSNLEYSRAEINNAALKGQEKELLYVDDPVELFFLHIQGSGVVKFSDGSESKLLFAGKNKHKYQSIGKKLIKMGEIAKADISAESIKRWLYDNPESRDEILNYNPSYIFFRLSKGEIIGGEGSKLSALNSIAIDKEFIPYSFPIWIDSKITDLANQKMTKPFHKLLIAQDTGSAIKSGMRGDVFFGTIENAQYFASHMNYPSKFYILIPKSLKKINLNFSHGS